MNVLITSGGTTEKIDAVRSICNISTGKLGSLIAERFSDESSIERIIYICSNSAIKPQSEKVEIINIDSVLCLENAVHQVFSHSNIDIIVHAMAVSDYKVKTVTSVTNIADLIISSIDQIKKSESAKCTVASLLKEISSVISANGKISSDIEDMLLVMERTPKIISIFKSLSPQSTLIGFKLLDNVPIDVLIDKGFSILIENKCAYVLANDLKDIKDERHIGYLIDKDKNYTQYSNKKEIASAIVSSVIGERAKKL